jgi:hypothetical protein
MSSRGMTATSCLTGHPEIITMRPVNMFNSHDPDKGKSHVPGGRGGMSVNLTSTRSFTLRKLRRTMIMRSGSLGRAQAITIAMNPTMIMIVRRRNRGRFIACSRKVPASHLLRAQL